MKGGQLLQRNGMTKITFKSLSVSDLDLLYQWFQVPHVKQWYARGTSYSREMINEKYHKRINDPDIPNYIIYLDHQPIGYIQFYKVSKSLPDGVNDYQHELFSKYDANKMIGIDMFIGETDYLGKHIASRALSEFISLYLQDYETIIVDPLKTNRHAIAFFTRNKFKKFQLNEGENELMVLELCVR